MVPAASIGASASDFKQNSQIMARQWFATLAVPAITADAPRGVPRTKNCACNTQEFLVGNGALA